LLQQSFGNLVFFFVHAFALHFALFALLFAFALALTLIPFRPEALVLAFLLAGFSERVLAFLAGFGLTGVSGGDTSDAGV
jgi:membrane protein YqaA with SNARE-associated domain